MEKREFLKTLPQHVATAGWLARGDGSDNPDRDVSSSAEGTEGIGVPRMQVVVPIIGDGQNQVGDGDDNDLVPQAGGSPNRSRRGQGRGSPHEDSRP